VATLRISQEEGGREGHHGSRDGSELGSLANFWVLQSYYQGARSEDGTGSEAQSSGDHPEISSSSKTDASKASAALSSAVASCKTSASARSTRIRRRGA